VSLKAAEGIITEMAVRRLADRYDPGAPSHRRTVKSPALERLRRDALAMFRSALKAVSPERAVAEAIRFEGGVLTVKGHRKRIAAPVVHLLAVGKGAAAMARGALGEVPIKSGLVVTGPSHSEISDPRLRIQMASHPLPDEGSLEAGRCALELADGLGRGDVLLALISGGASSMMEATPVSLGDLRQAYDVLLRSGLGIRDVNEVRKGISELKGGRLGERAAARGARVISLIVSDIVGNPIDDIGSGPTAPNSSRGARAEEILRKANLWEEMPASVRNRLAEASKAPKVWRDRSHRVHAFVVADNKRAVRAAATEATARGYRCGVLTTSLQGEARSAGRWLVGKALAQGGGALKRATIAGGETTVTVRGSGRGGRNQELALAAARPLAGNRVVLLSCGTDGIDGTSEAAGAFVDGETYARAQAEQLDPEDFLERNDSHTFFEALGDLVVTGPTGTNVGDIQILLEDRSARRP
jgi:glycerate 2-kinase